MWLKQWLGTTIGVTVLACFTARCGEAPAKEYWVKLVCESSDRIATVRFGPKGATLEKTTETRILQSDISGPHGIVFSPDRKNFYVSIGHGRPYGTAVKYSTEDDRAEKQVGLGLFPATEDVTPDGNFLFVVNFNLHGDAVPSSVSVVDTNQMMEVARIPTCVMPHGSRVTRDGARQYSACMMDDLLVEVDTEKMKVSRSFRVSQGLERGYTNLPQKQENTEKMERHDVAAMNMNGITCSPTWAQPSVEGTRVYVACNKSNEIVEVDARSWTLKRRIPAGNGVYNLGVTPDGKMLIATNKRDASISIFEIASGKELARIPTKRKVVHGVVISLDSRYAFVTVEGVGVEPGTVEVVDLEVKKTVAIVDTPPQAAGIDFWKIE
jgi:DNA-binding beta-propeller fold protein YncE